MAHRACFYLSGNAETATDTDELLVELDDAIPLCWLAMCAPEHLTSYVDHAGRIQPFVLVPLGDARQNYAARLPLLQDYFTNIDGWLSAGERMLRAARLPFIKGDLSAILRMRAEAGQGFLDALAFFDHPDEDSLADLLALTRLAEQYQPATRAVNLEHGSRVPSLLVGKKIAAWLPWDDPDEMEQRAIAAADDLVGLPSSAAAATARHSPCIGKPLIYTNPRARRDRPWWQFWKR